MTPCQKRLLRIASRGSREARQLTGERWRTAISLKAKGFITIYVGLDPKGWGEVEITPAGRAALSQREGE